MRTHFLINFQLSIILLFYLTTNNPEEAKAEEAVIFSGSRTCPCKKEFAAPEESADYSA